MMYRWCLLLVVFIGCDQSAPPQVAAPLLPLGPAPVSEVVTVEVENAPPITPDTPIVGKVSRIIDGDTIVLLDRHKRVHRIRLNGIDASERKQPYSAKTTEALRELVGDTEVVVTWGKKDRYGRILGDVLRDPSSELDSVNTMLVRAGWA
jgi:endonuclease YncB( thermonuclease family)